MPVRVLPVADPAARRVARTRRPVEGCAADPNRVVHAGAAFWRRSPQSGDALGVATGGLARRRSSLSPRVELSGASQPDGRRRGGELIAFHNMNVARAAANDIAATLRAITPFLGPSEHHQRSIALRSRPSNCAAP